VKSGGKVTFFGQNANRLDSYKNNNAIIQAGTNPPHVFVCLAKDKASTKNLPRLTAKIVHDTLQNNGSRCIFDVINI
jgi:hypothetical protein